MTTLEAVLAGAGAASGLAGGLGGLYVLIVKPGKRIRQAADTIADFRDDWVGVEERPGVPGRPGVMVRLASIEEQLHANHGTS
ncbi:hypothetical protein, partial [Planotetraspora phitsanulokensis]